QTAPRSSTTALRPFGSRSTQIRPLQSSSFSPYTASTRLSSRPRNTRPRRPPSCSARWSLRSTPQRTHMARPFYHPSSRFGIAYNLTGRRAMAKEIFCVIGVEVDAVAGWLGSYAGEDSPADISRGIFAGEVGTRRLLKMFDKYDMTTTWFIPGHSIET